MVSSRGLVRSPYAILRSVFSDFPVASEMAGHCLGPAVLSRFLTYARRSECSIGQQSISRQRYTSIPLTGYFSGDTPCVSKLKEIQGVLAENVERLRRQFAPEGKQRTMNGFAKYCGIGNSALQAIKGATGDPQLSTLCKIAARFQMEAWHLFLPGASPAHRPKVLTPREQAFYSALEAARDALGDPDGGSPLPPQLPPPVPRKAVAHKRRKPNK